MFCVLFRRRSHECSASVENCGAAASWSTLLTFSSGESWNQRLYCLKGSRRERVRRNMHFDSGTRVTFTPNGPAGVDGEREREKEIGLFHRKQWGICPSYLFSFTSGS